METLHPRSDHLISERSDSRRHLEGAIEGVWVGPHHDDHRPLAQPDGAVLPRLTQNSNERDLRCLDLVPMPIVGSPTDWAWCVLSTAATGTYGHTIGLDRGDPWRFQATDTQLLYDVSYDQELPPDRIAKLYGRTAAERARTDRPAVQLRLTPVNPPIVVEKK